VSRPAWRRLACAEARMTSGAGGVAGVDEAGRGPLAGPVVAAAVILEPGRRWDGLDDSKQVRPDVRVELYAQLRDQARAFAWSVVGPRHIDFANIRNASLEAMRRAVCRLKLRPEVVLVDGRDPVPGISCAQHAVIDGDARLLSVAAASILAKVVRDRIMERLDGVWPAYGFAKHKGYSTPEHMEALRLHGPCPLHRYSFTRVCALELPLV